MVVVGLSFSPEISDRRVHEGFVVGLLVQIGVDSSRALAYRVCLHSRRVLVDLVSLLPVSRAYSSALGA